MRMRLVTLLVVTSLMMSACWCAPGVTGLTPAQLVATPSPLTMPATFVGQRTTLTLTLTNTGSAPADVTPAVEAPFFVDGTALSVGRGEEVALVVSFAPTQPGPVTGALRLGELVVPLEAEGLEVPACGPAAACTEVSFDVAQRRCVETTRVDGAACETRCVRGVCSAGVCAGALLGCETGNACLVPTCSEATGCSSVPRRCPAPASACQVATCDAVSGCGVADVPDGTLCGPDECLATRVDVCVAGQCVPRARPATARCSNRWLPTTVPSRSGPDLAWDGVRRQLLAFGGNTNGTLMDDTWAFDGVRWEQRLPIASPAPRYNHRMVWDGARRRVVLFGGLQPSASAETWEWDGVTWLERRPAVSPPAASTRDALGLAFDSVRRRVVLHGSAGTWEWDGVTWHHPASATMPTATRDFSLAFDAASQRVVLFGGRFSTFASDPMLNETWQWDGVSWRRASPVVAPPARVQPAMVWDAARNRVVLFGGYDGAGPRTDTWEWDGTRWLERTPASAPPPEVAGAVMAFDEARQRVVLFGGTAQALWEWNGVTWLNTPSAVRPPFLWETALASDTTRHRVVLFGGRTLVPVDGTREWDGASWAQRQPTTSPPARSSHALAFDPLRQRVVLFGGEGATGRLADTWEWDGTAWLERLPQTAPPAMSGHTMAWDPGRQRVVAFTTNALWEWDGTTWQQSVPTGTGPMGRGELAFDPVGQRLVLVTFDTTWLWNAGWTRVVPEPLPQVSWSRLSLDPVRQRLMLLARSRSSGPMVTLEWTGLAWANRNPAAAPPNFFDFSLTWDAASARMLAFSGADTWVYLP